MHLKPLRIQFENVEECDYLELPLRFPAVFHVVCLIWANSTHYRHPARLVVLLQEVSNLVIDLVCPVAAILITMENYFNFYVWHPFP
jgi:dynein heavy chain